MKTARVPLLAAALIGALLGSVSLRPPAATAQELYDLCYAAEPLTAGRLLFVRYRYPLLDPVLRTFETYMFDPRTKKITLLQKYEEKLYIPPIVSWDGSTACWHSLIEGNDFLMTSNFDQKRASRLRFDTGGYFMSIAIDYDNDSVAASIKRGLNKQGLYIISNRQGTIRRLKDGTEFSEIGFLANGNICYVDNADGRRVLGFLGEKKGTGMVIEEVDYVRKTLRGDGILYSKGPSLFLFRIYGTDSVQISQQFDAEENPPLLSRDGTTAAVPEQGSIRIVNIPSGDVLYLLSVDTAGTNALLTDFTFYLAKGRKVFALKHKKTDQSLVELFEHREEVRLLAASPDDRYLVFQGRDGRSVFIRDSQERDVVEKRFTQNVVRVLYAENGTAFYAVTHYLYPEYKHPVRELFRYDFAKASTDVISAATNTDINLYLRNE